MAGEPAYPLWDGQESVAEYAKKVGLPATKTLDLGGGVKMELVLIPAGKFIMGTPEPTPVDEDGFHNKILIGQALLGAFGMALLVMLVVVIVRAVRKRQRPKYSLLWFLLMIVMAGGCVLSGLHWRWSVRGLETARAEYGDKKADFENIMYPNEKPAHRVTITMPLYVGKFDVTQEQYQQVAGVNPSEFKGKDNPVENVSWNDAQEFCRTLSEKTKQTVRLPTEAEWEYASCDEAHNTRYRGLYDEELDQIAWYALNSKDTTHPVGQKKANAFGLYDMHGNVWQWCQDWLGHDYYSKSPVEDPQGAGYEEPGHRVNRGGGWEQHDPYYIRSAYRSNSSPDSRDHSTGFRVVSPVSSTP